jgi:arginyl-tRNA synthetase
MIQDRISENLANSLEKIGIKNAPVDLSRPANPSYGDYATSIALKLTKKLKKTPLDIAETIVKNLAIDKNIANIKVIKPVLLIFG